MKGVILAGGFGTRLKPLTNVTNKHLLPVFHKPMILYPVDSLKEAGITDIMIVTGGENMGDVIRFLGSGKEFGVNFTYKCQDGAGGVPVALSLAKDFVGNDKCVCILGDNVIEESIKQYVEDFSKSEKGAKILLKEVPDPERFGIAEIKDNKVVATHEKLKNPPSNLAVIGIYMFDNKCFDIIPNLQPSTRGELEITHIINEYIKNNNLTHSIVKGFWIDAGKLETLHQASKFMADKHLK